MKRLFAILVCTALAAALTACGGQSLDRNGPANGENNFVPPQDAAEPAAPGGAEPAKETGTVWRSDDGKETHTERNRPQGKDPRAVANSKQRQYG